VFGTGPTHHDAFSTQNGQIYVVDLKLGPTYTDVNNSTLTSHGPPKKRLVPCTTSLPCTNSDTAVASGALREYDTGRTGSFMGDAVTIDYDVDYRVDAIYAGSVICTGNTDSAGCKGSAPVWKGAMWRLTTNGGDINPDNWGILASGSQAPTAVISTFAYTTPQASTCARNSPCNVGPITTAPTLTQDDTHNLWLFFGTGRYYASADKGNVDIQHFFGVKDPCIVSGGCTDQTVERNNLFNSSNVVTCSSCASGTNVSTTGSTSSFTTGFSSGSGSLVNTIQNMDGWFTTFNDPLRTPSLTPGERNLSSATLLGGTVFFTSFLPSTDMCQATGTGQLYAVYYLTGGPYTSSSIGSAASGSNTLISKSLSLGQGLPTQMQLHIGAELPLTPTGPTTPGDCAGSRVIGITQTSTGAAPITCVKPAKSFYSRMIAWRDL
jgi:type IV pilus assembly protein PilY1